MDLVADMLLDRLQREHGDGDGDTRPAADAAARRRLPAPRAGVVRRRSHRRPPVGLPAARRAASRAASTSFTSSITATRSSSTGCRRAHARDVPRSRHVPHVLDPAREPRSAVPRDDAADPRRAAHAGHVACDSRGDARRARRQSRDPADGRPSCPTVRIRAARLKPSRRPTSRPRGCSVRAGASSCCTSAARSRASGSTSCCASSIRCAARDRRCGSCASAGRSPPSSGARARSRSRRAVVVLPFLDRSTLAAVYRRSALAAAAVRARRLRPAGARSAGVRHAGRRERHPGAARGRRDAVVYCPLDDIEAWTTRDAAARRAARTPAQWTPRREAGIRRAAAFSWSRYASDVAALYARVAAAPMPS